MGKKTIAWKRNYTLITFIVLSGIVVSWLLFQEKIWFTFFGLFWRPIGII